MSIRSNKKIRGLWKPFLLLILCLPLSSFFVSAQQQTRTDQPRVFGRTLDPRTRIPIITITEENMFPQSWLAPPIQARATSLSRREMQRSRRALEDAMGKYPDAYLVENIKRIYLLGSLTLYGMPCDGTVSSDSLYIVNRGTEEYSDEYIALTFHTVFANLTQEKNRRRSGYETSDVVRLLPERRSAGAPSIDPLMKLVYEGDQDGPEYIYALEKTGFVGLTLFKQFRNLPPRSEIQCPLRCREIKQSVPASLREAIEKHIFSYHWTAEDSAPVWSNDGKQIVFLSGRDNAVSELYVMDLDGRNIRRLTRTSYSPYQSTGFSPAVWGPDNRQLAYAMHPGGPSKLYVVNADGTRQKRLPVDNGTNSGIFLIGWLPDRRILFLSVGYDRSRTIYSILPDGSGLNPLTEKGTVVSEAFLSPDQRLIAISAASSLVIKDLNTNTILDSFYYDGVNAVSWSPSSKQIAFANGGGITIRDLETNTIRHVSDLAQPMPGKSGQPLYPSSRKIFGISWSLDGKQIAYGVGSAIIRNGVDPTELRAINVDGTGARRLAFDGYLPVWSPDGRYIVFSRLQARLYLVRADGTDERYLASGLYAKWIR